MQTLQKIAYQDTEIKTPNFLREKYLEYFKIFKHSMDELMKYTDWISLSNSID